MVFNLFINDLMFFIEETDVCNFANDAAIYLCSVNLKDVILKLSNDRNLVLNWFRINRMVVNPGKFQIMFLVSNIDNSKKRFMIESKRKKFRSEVKLLGIIIDDKLPFTTQIENLCSTSSNHFRALERIRKCLSSEQAKHISEAYIISTFTYCPLIWIFCNNTASNLLTKSVKVSHVLYMKWKMQILKIY